jgi:hypothetical protein
MISNLKFKIPELVNLMTPEQMAFIRKHGITHCPPGPVTPMVWGNRPCKNDGLSEEDLLRLMATLRDLPTLSEGFQLDKMKRQAKKNCKL